MAYKNSKNITTRKGKSDSMHNHQGTERNRDVEQQVTAFNNLNPEKKLEELFRQIATVNLGLSGRVDELEEGQKILNEKVGDLEAEHLELGAVQNRQI